MEWKYSLFVVSNCVGPHGLQNARLPCLLYLPEFAQIHVLWINDAIQPAHPLCPLLLWPAIFLSIRVFTSGSQSIKASASVLPMNIQGWFPGWTSLTPCSPRDSQESSPTPQFKSTHSSVLRFIVQLSHPYMTTGKTIALTRQNFVSKVMVVTWSAWLQSKGWELPELKAWSQQIRVTHWTSSTIVISVLQPG